MVQIKTANNPQPARRWPTRSARSSATCCSDTWAPTATSPSRPSCSDSSTSASAARPAAPSPFRRHGFSKTDCCTVVCQKLLLQLSSGRGKFNFKSTQLGSQKWFFILLISLMMIGLRILQTTKYKVTKTDVKILVRYEVYLDLWAITPAGLPPLRPQLHQRPQLPREPQAPPRVLRLRKGKMSSRFNS